MSRNKWVWILAIAVLAGGGFAYWRWTLHPLPASSEIESAKVRFYHRKQQRELDVDIPEKVMAQLLSTLQPASKVGAPSDAAIWGHLKIVTKDHGAWNIVLFDTGDHAIVYEVAREGQVGCYRGGDRRALEELLGTLEK